VLDKTVRVTDTFCKNAGTVTSIDDPGRLRRGERFFRPTEIVECHREKWSETPVAQEPLHGIAPNAQRIVVSPKGPIGGTETMECAGEFRRQHRLGFAPSAIVVFGDA